MTISTNVASTATDPKTGMTLDELAAFVQEAMRAGVPGDRPVKVVANMRGGIKKVETRA
ncbi:hypothetical protein [Sphaerisporangium sp. NPDC051011]|uniref:hypothetical protein n=1 Tax=Sphaerisporangium sp. NPDC051011 TaxID=3155792 RepID=UPI0033C5B9CB